MNRTTRHFILFAAILLFITPKIAFSQYIQPKDVIGNWISEDKKWNCIINKDNTASKEGDGPPENNHGKWNIDYGSVIIIWGNGCWDRLFHPIDPKNTMVENCHGIRYSIERVNVGASGTIDKPVTVKSDAHKSPTVTVSGAAISTPSESDWSAARQLLEIVSDQVKSETNKNQTALQRSLAEEKCANQIKEIASSIRYWEFEVIDVKGYQGAGVDRSDGLTGIIRLNKSTPLTFKEGRPFWPSGENGNIEVEIRGTTVTTDGLLDVRKGERIQVAATFESSLWATAKDRELRARGLVTGPDLILKLSLDNDGLRFLKSKPNSPYRVPVKQSGLVRIYLRKYDGLYPFGTEYELIYNGVSYRAKHTVLVSNRESTDSSLLKFKDEEGGSLSSFIVPVITEQMPENGFKKGDWLTTGSRVPASFVKAVAETDFGQTQLANVKSSAENTCANITQAMKLAKISELKQDQALISLTYLQFAFLDKYKYESSENMLKQLDLWPIVVKDVTQKPSDNKLVEISGKSVGDNCPANVYATTIFDERVAAIKRGDSIIVRGRPTIVTFSRNLGFTVNLSNVKLE